MKTAKVTLWGRYVYDNVEYSNDMRAFAMNIALAVHKKENRTKYTKNPRTYNYIYECLNRKRSCINFRTNSDNSENNYKESMRACNELNNNSEWVQKIDDRGIVYYEHQDYRLGYTQSNTLILDVDGKDMTNLSEIVGFYEMVLDCKFKIISTKKGYWLFSDKKYETPRSWLFDNCRVLCPALNECDMDDYRNGLLSLDNDKDDKFKRATPETIKSSEFYKAPSNLSFDVAFQFLSIKRERSTIRITKKCKNDKIEEIVI